MVCCPTNLLSHGLNCIPPPPLLRHLRNPPTTNLRKLQQTQAQILTNPRLRRTHNSLVTQFISSYARSLGHHYASLFLQHLPKPDPSLWNLVIRSSAESGSGMQFLGFYNAMLRENIPPDKATFSTLLRALAGLSEDKAGEAIHCQILKTGFDSDMFLRTGLLDFYAKVGPLGSAKQLFDEMCEKDVVVYNVMIAALGSHGCVVDARKLFDEMPEKSSASWNSMITCYCKCDDIDSAREIFDQNRVKDLVSWNAMIDGYCKLGRLAMACELFDRMGSAKNHVTWNTMIVGYVHHRKFSVAISMFRQMQTEEVRPTEVTMVSLLSACAHLGALDMGKWIHAFVRNHNFKIDVVLGNALIDMYYKCGSMETALEIFHWMPTKNVFCWNSIIVGLGMHGYGKQAIEAFLEMEKEKRIKPDGITFVGLLSGCSHSGLVSEGRKYFSQMLDIYGVEPKIEHYGCMVDLLGRAGFLKEALNLIGTMPIKPNSIVWGSLLRACKIHKDTMLTEKVTQHLVELDPNDGGNYVFLSNMYASMNRWDDVESCRRIMMEKGVRKIPGCSSVEVNNMVHEFVVGDTSHPQFEQISAFLGKIDRELRKLGYEPNTDSVLHDIGEEEKENAVKYHSEKVAVAFGLMNTREGNPIRVVKNLRICSDCHEALKLIAKLFRREIIVRDRNRFHHFIEGFCSCKDYW